MFIQSTTTALVLALACLAIVPQPVYTSTPSSKEDEKSKEKNPKPGFLSSYIKMPTFGKPGKKGNQEQAGLASKSSEAHGPGGGSSSLTTPHSDVPKVTVVLTLLDHLNSDLFKGLQRYLTSEDLKVMYETPTSDITSPALKTIMAMDRPQILRAIYDELDVTSLINQGEVFPKLESLLLFNGYDGEKKFFVLDKDTPWNVLGKVADAYMNWLSFQDKPKTSLHKLFSFAASAGAYLLFRIVGVGPINSHNFKFQEKLELVIKEYQANEDPAAFVYQGRKWDHVVKGRTYTGIPTLGITNRPMPTTPLGENDIPLTDEPWEIESNKWNSRMMGPFLFHMLGPNDENGVPTMHYSVVLSMDWNAVDMKRLIRYGDLAFKQRKSLKSYFRALAQERGFTVNFDVLSAIFM